MLKLQMKLYLPKKLLLRPKTLPNMHIRRRRNIQHTPNHRIFGQSIHNTNRRAIKPIRNSSNSSRLPMRRMRKRRHRLLRTWSRRPRQHCTRICILGLHSYKNSIKNKRCNSKRNATIKNNKTRLLENKQQLVRTNGKRTKKRRKNTRNRK